MMDRELNAIWDASIPKGLHLMPPLFPWLPANMPEVEDDGPITWTSAIHIEDPDEVLCLWFFVLSFVTIWGVNLWMEDLSSFSFSL